MQHSINELYAGDDRIRFGTTLLGHDEIDPSLQQHLPPGVAYDPTAEARWRYLDWPDRGCEGVLILLPPGSSASGELVAWYVTRYCRSLGLFHAHRPLSSEQIAYVRNQDTIDQEVLSFLKETGRFHMDNSRAPIISVMSAYMESYLTDLQQRIKACGHEPSEELMTIARRRELWMITVGNRPGVKTSFAFILSPNNRALS